MGENKLREVEFDVIHTDAQAFRLSTNDSSIGVKLSAFIPNSDQNIDESFLNLKSSNSKLRIHIPRIVHSYYPCITVVISIFVNDPTNVIAESKIGISTENLKTSCPERLIFKTLAHPAHYVCTIVWVYSVKDCDCHVPELDNFSLIAKIESKTEDIPHKESDEESYSVGATEIPLFETPHVHLLLIGTSQSSSHRLAAYSKLLQLHTKPRPFATSDMHDDFVINGLVPLVATFSADSIMKQVNCNDAQFEQCLLTLQLSCQYLFHSIQSPTATATNEPIVESQGKFQVK